jgi:glyoxylase-like metal-dependent hydrolase (beta-lactamase superfamily II)
MNTHYWKWWTLSDGYTQAPEAVVLKGGSWLREIRFLATSFLLEHPEHGCVLVDTGYSSRMLGETAKWPGRVYRWITPITLTEPGGIAACLRKIGKEPKDIRQVVVTHFHADHVGGLRDFPHAEILCSASAWAHVQALRDRPWSALRHGLLPGLLPGDLESRIRIVDFDQPLFANDGLRFHSLPGHAVGQIGVEFRVGEGQEVMLVADASWLTQAIAEDRPPHAVTRLLHDGPAYLKTLRRLHEWRSSRPDLLMVPSHCPLTAERIAP